MFWIGTGALLIIFFSSRAYLNNKKNFRSKIKADQYQRLYFWVLQGSNLILILAGLLFLMLAIVSHVNGFEVVFSSEAAYHMKLNGD